jgi:hypothetical protein
VDGHSNNRSNTSELFATITLLHLSLKPLQTYSPIFLNDDKEKRGGRVASGPPPSSCIGLSATKPDQYTPTGRRKASGMSAWFVVSSERANMRTLLMALLAIFATAGQCYGERAPSSLEEGLRELLDLQKLEADDKKNLPIKVDENTTLVDLQYETRRTSYWYVVDLKTLDARELEQRIQKQLCSNSLVARTMKQTGFSYQYHYVNKAKVVLGSFAITNCP